MRSNLGRFLAMIILINFTACEEKFENLLNSPKNGTKLNSRTEEGPGEFSISGGIMSFPTVQDFNQTINYLLESNDSIQTIWRSSFNMLTPQKVYLNFLNQWEALGDDNPQSEEDLELAYSDSIRILYDEDDEKSYLPRFAMLNEFLNLNGLLRIGSTLIKITESKLISITNPQQHSNQSQYNDQTQTDTSIGVIVCDLTPRSPQNCPCNSSFRSKYVLYPPGFNYPRRFTIEQSIQLAYYWTYISSIPEYQCNFIIDAAVLTEHHKYGSLGIWTGQRINSTLNHNSTGEVNLDNSIWGFSIGSTTKNVVNKMNNNMRLTKSLGGLSSSFAYELEPELCITSYYTRISRDGHQNYFGLAECD